MWMETSSVGKLCVKAGREDATKMFLAARVEQGSWVARIDSKAARLQCMAAMGGEE
jgi:hypothetical protein